MKVQQKPTLIEEVVEEGNEYYVAKEIAKQLESSKEKVIRGDQDRVFIIDGAEGSGKSRLALQLAYFLDKSFCLDDVVFNGNDLQRRIRSLAEKGIKHKAIIFDEAFNGLSSKSAISKMNKDLVRLFMEMRQLNLFVFIVLPSIFLLEKYVGLFRSHVLFHVFISKKDVKRRYYKTYNRKNKKTLFLLGQKMFSYSKPFIKFNYRFYAKFPPTINEKEYLDKKLRSFHEVEEKDREHKWKIQRDFMVWKYHQATKETFVDMAKMFLECEEPVHESMIGEICKTLRRKAEKSKAQ